LRRERFDPAAEAFDRAAARNANQALGNSWQVDRPSAQKASPLAAIDLLRELPKANIDARNQTYLAQAHLAVGNLTEAVSKRQMSP
jgi:hypothetical protein